MFIWVLQKTIIILKWGGYVIYIARNGGDVTSCLKKVGIFFFIRIFYITER